MTFDASFFVLVSTVLTFVCLFRPVGKKIKQVLDNYAGAVEKRIDEARMLREKAKEHTAQTKLNQVAAEQKSKDIVAQAHALSKVRHEELLAKYDRIMARKERLSEARIQRAQEDVQNELSGILSLKAMKFSEQLLAKQYPLVKNDRCAEEAIKRISTAF